MCCVWCGVVCSQMKLTMTAIDQIDTPEQRDMIIGGLLSALRVDATVYVACACLPVCVRAYVCAPCACSSLPTCWLSALLIGMCCSLLSHRVSEPAALVKLQQKHWDPLLEFMKEVRRLVRLAMVAHSSIFLCCSGTRGRPQTDHGHHCGTCVSLQSCRELPLNPLLWLVPS